WEDNHPVEHDMGLVAKGFVPKARSTLSYPNCSDWPLDSQGKPNDPWSKFIYVPMVGLDSFEVYTFSTGADGGRRRCIGPLSGEYGQRIRQHPGELPVVRPDQGSYLHTDRAIGRVKYPSLPVVKWVPGDEYIAAVAAAASSQQMKQLEDA